VVLVCGLAVWAQPTVPVTVRVTDRTGALVPRAIVAFSQTANDPGKNVETDANGRATVALIPGSYALRVEAPGFRVDMESVAFSRATELPVMLDVGQTCPPCLRIVQASAEEIPTQASLLTAMIQGGPAQTPAPASGYTPVTVVVTGSDGAAVAGAEIRVTPGSPAGDKLITDEQGRAQLGMPAGQYMLRVSAQGFGVVDKVVVVGDKAQTVPVALAAAAEDSGATEVNGAAPMSPGAVPLETTQGAGHTANAGTQPAVAGVLTIVGANGKRGVFTPQTLREYPQTTVKVKDVRTNQEKTYGGVPLMDLLAHLGVPKMAMGKALAKYLLATGSDGFDAVLSLAEVDPALHAGTVLVADAVDGKPLDAKAGPFQLVVSQDKRPVRSVRNLVRIEVRTAE
jgi:hypothetical protein